MSEAKRKEHEEKIKLARDKNDEILFMKKLVN